MIVEKTYVGEDEVKYICDIKTQLYMTCFKPKWSEISSIDFATHLFINSNINLETVEADGFKEFVQDAKQIKYMEYGV